MAVKAGFAGLADDGSPRWSAQIDNPKAVHTFPKGWVNKRDHPYSWNPSVVYDALLGVYLMGNWGIGSDSAGNWFTKPSYLVFDFADHSWGPWRQVHEEMAWLLAGSEPGGQCYQLQIMPGRIADDGKSFWLAWTQFPKGHYIQCQKVESRFVRADVAVAISNLIYFNRMLPRSGRGLQFPTSATLCPECRWPTTVSRQN